jgi:signal peptidase I
MTNFQAIQDALALELFSDLLLRCHNVRIRVTGSSMLPCLFPGDTLLVEPQEFGKIALGDLVVFEQRGELITHRVIGLELKKDLPYLLTRGDSVPWGDPPVFANQLRGRVLSITRDSLHLSPRLNYWGKLASMIVRHSGFVKNCLLFLLNRTTHLIEGAQCRP